MNNTNKKLRRCCSCKNFEAYDNYAISGKCHIGEIFIRNARKQERCANHKLQQEAE